MAVVCCNVGIGACNLGIGALYLNIHKPLFAVIWIVLGVGWFGVAALNWRTHRIVKRVRRGGEW